MLHGTCSYSTKQKNNRTTCMYKGGQFPTNTRGRQRISWFTAGNNIPTLGKLVLLARLFMNDLIQAYRPHFSFRIKIER